MSGDEEDSFTLRHTNVSHPRLARTLSARSIVAIAEEFPVAPTGSSSGSDGHFHGTDLSGISTPPPDLTLGRASLEEAADNDNTLAHDSTSSERYRIGLAQREPLTSESLGLISHSHSETPLPQAAPGVAPFLPSTETAMNKMQEGSSSDSQSSQNGSRTSENRIRRKPVPKESPTVSLDRERSIQERDSRIGSSTSAAGDAPFIRFALDQLTRDEDVRGSRKYPQNTIDTAIVNIARAQQGGSVSSSVQQPSRNLTPIEKLMIQCNESVATIPMPIPSRHPARAAEPSSPLSQFRADSTPQPNVLISFDRDMNSLRFLPMILRPSMMAIYMVLVLLMLAALTFCGIWSGVKPGLYNYTQFGGGRYFIFRYFQTICGMVLLLWLFQIQVAVQRVAPFLAMASLSLKSRGEAPLMEVQPTNFLLPKIFYFRSGQPVIGVCMLIFWFQIFTVPLLASLFNVYFYGAIGTGYWRWVAVQPIVWTLFGLYFLLLLALLTLAVWIRSQRTGLRWDPRSIADLIALLDRSNIMQGYTGSEIFPHAKDFRERLAGRTDRLGYWHSTRKTMHVFYALGEEAAPTRRYSLEQGRIREKAPEHATAPPEPHPLVLRALEDSEEYHQIRHRYLPWFLRPAFVALWSILAILLYIAFLVVSFVNQAVLYGFAPLLTTAATKTAFSATNFVYSFIPAVIAQLLFLSWLSIDYAFRRLQPYASMNAPGDQGAPAEHSLLLDYQYRLPFSVTLAAAVSKHYSVAWFSLVSLVAAPLPVLAGGCFWSQFFVPQQQVRVAVDPTAFYALCVFLAILAFTIPLVFLGLSRRRLPHANTTLAEQFSWLYQSRILGEDATGATEDSPLTSKPAMATRLMSASTGRERGFSAGGGEGRYMFGRFQGRDGRAHLGIERIGRDNRLAGGPPRVAPAVRASPTLAQQERHPRMLLNTPSTGTPFPERLEYTSTDEPVVESATEIRRVG